MQVLGRTSDTVLGSVRFFYFKPDRFQSKEKTTRLADRKTKEDLMANINVKCPHCGAVFITEDTYLGRETVCNSCQQTFIVTAVPAKSRTAYILLGFFLGGLGIQDFYAGYMTRGFIKLGIWLLCCGGFITSSWSIVDICTIKTDVNGIPFE